MAVYTEVSDEELIDFVGAYDIGDVVSFKGIAEGVENSSYLLQAPTGAYVLTLYERRVRESALRYFVGCREERAALG
ncbi:MAG: homoserine kinase, partial [Rhodospirillaceae bacterium]|nr:homoserine kinase [Rhodospirillaceae bacterium]